MSVYNSIAKRYLPGCLCTAARRHSPHCGGILLPVTQTRPHHTDVGAFASGERMIPVLILKDFKPGQIVSRKILTRPGEKVTITVLRGTARQSAYRWGQGPLNLDPVIFASYHIHPAMVNQFNRTKP